MSSNSSRSPRPCVPRGERNSWFKDVGTKLVTTVSVDTTGQYDAVRAYLKELDISNAVWVGLIRSNPDGDFTWTDYRGLSGEGYWSAAPDARASPLCAAADPSADYRWEARACGGPTVASFICELPVPQWALGAEGCMVRALPDLTVLYLPESAAVQLTTDCGLDGVKRVLCTGNVKHEEILKNLSCAEETETEAEETFTSISANISVSSTPWTTVAETSYSEFETTKNQIITKEPTVTVDDVKELSSSEAPMTTNVNMNQSQNENSFIIHENKNGNLSMSNFKQNSSANVIAFNKNLKLDANTDNIQANDIPKQMIENDLSMSDNIDELEDEQHMQHKILHDQLARHGNFETIFSQPSDHFVPPLVMAKAKMSDDMTVLSLEQKYAQQIVEQHNARYKNRITDLNTEIQNENKGDEHVKSENLEKLNVLETTTKTFEFIKDNFNAKNIVSTQKETANNKLDAKVNKVSSPKKYKGNDYAIKEKTGKRIETVTKKINEKHSDNDSLPDTKSRIVREKILSEINNTSDPDDDVSIDLKVIVKTPNETETYIINDKMPSNTLDTNLIHRVNVKDETNDSNASSTENTNSGRFANRSDVYDHQVIKVIVPTENRTTPLTFEITTRIAPESLKTSELINYGNLSTSTLSPVIFTEETFKTTTTSTNFSRNFANIESNLKIENTSTIKIKTKNTSEIFSTAFPLISTETPITEKTNTDYIKIARPSTENPKTSTETAILPKDRSTPNFKNSFTNNSFSEIHIDNIHDLDLDHYNQTSCNDTLNCTNNLESSTPHASETTEDFQSPLLSGAADPVSKPNRSRRPPIPPNRNKFNPFRILG